MDCGNNTQMYSNSSKSKNMTACQYQCVLFYSTKLQFYFLTAKNYIVNNI